MELFPGEEHMRDERGSSVSLFHFSQRALGVRLCRCLVFGFGWGFLFCLLFLLCVSTTQCFLLHNYCKRTVLLPTRAVFLTLLQTFADRQSFRASAAGALKKKSGVCFAFLFSGKTATVWKNLESFSCARGETV